jgi:4-hydroxy-3-methylbut-2-enyl diphosphate reductase
VDADATRLLVVTPLRLEYAAVRRALPEALVMRSGMGPERARASALRAASMQASAIAVAGFCGAVAGDLLPGDVVVAGEVRGPAGVITCRSGPLVAALAALGVGRVRVGTVISAGHVVRGRERSLLAGEGAAVVDMESAWLAPAAAGRPFVVLRVVLDTPAHEIYHPATLSGGLRAWRALRRAVPALAIWAGAHPPLESAGPLSPSEVAPWPEHLV